MVVRQIQKMLHDNVKVEEALVIIRKHSFVYVIITLVLMA
jgi:hypothetical protein